MLCDFALDFVSSIGVTLALVVIYSLDLEERDVFGIKWFDDVWLANATNEFQLILVASWADLVLRLVFALSMINNINLLKRFVSMATDQTGSKEGSRHAWSAIVPASTRSHSHKRRSSATGMLVGVNNVVRAYPVLTKFQRIIFTAWGTAVLALHVSASFGSELPQCVMQVRPWGDRTPVVQPCAHRLLSR